MKHDRPARGGNAEELGDDYFGETHRIQLSKPGGGTQELTEDVECDGGAQMQRKRDTSLGAVLTDAKGMTLYTFSRDDAGSSNCYGKCAEYWPPLTVEAGDEPVGEFLIAARDDGASQWSHRGQPLYLFALDKQPGDTMGEVAGDVSVAHPSMQ